MLTSTAVSFHVNTLLLLLRHGNASHSVPFACVELVDVILKSSLQLAGVLPALGLPLACRFVLHTITPLTVCRLGGTSFRQILLLYSTTEYLELLDNWLVNHLDPILAIVLSLVLFLSIIPACLFVRLVFSKYSLSKSSSVCFSPRDQTIRLRRNACMFRICCFQEGIV